MNVITLTGNIGRDAETRYLQDGTAVLSFSVADSQGKDKPAIWWSCSMFGKRAESLSQYLLKGQQVTVAGQVTENEFTAKDGTPKKAFSVRVVDVALQGGKRDGGADTAATERPATAPASTGTPVYGQKSSVVQLRQQTPKPQQDDVDNDIPF